MLSTCHHATEPTFGVVQGIGVLPADPKDAKLILTNIKEEKIVTRETRQQAFENFDTTDDHLMHIVGKVKDKDGLTSSARRKLSVEISAMGL